MSVAASLSCSLLLVILLQIWLVMLLDVVLPVL